MAYVKIDDGFHDHPRVQECSLAAVGLWTLALSWCRRHLTDGRIRAATVQRLCNDRARLRATRELVACGLWIAEDDGFRFRDYLEHNDSRDEIMQARQRDRDRKRQSRGVGSGSLSARTPSGRTADGGRNPLANPTQPNPTQPISKDPTDPLSDKQSDGAGGQLALSPDEPARDVVKETWERFCRERKAAHPGCRKLTLTPARRAHIRARLKSHGPGDIELAIRNYFDPRFFWAQHGHASPDLVFRSAEQLEKVRDAKPRDRESDKPAAPAPAYHKPFVPPTTLSDLTKDIGNGGLPPSRGRCA